MTAPLKMQWTGEAFVPVGAYWQRKADDELTVGEIYQVSPGSGRSQVSHNHYFAAISDAHSNLPDDMLEIYPTPEHLRKKALIRKGYRDEREFVCDSEAAARRLVMTIRPLDDYAIIEARGCVVRIWTAKSQSKAAMPGNKEFQQSKSDVLDFIDDLLGVDRGAVAEHAGKAA